MRLLHRLVLLALLAVTPMVPAEPAPQFQLPALGDGTVELADHDGKLVVVNFWAPWCPPCREEIPELADFHQNHEDTVVLGLALDSEREEVRDMAELMDIPYPVAYADEETVEGFGGVIGLPTTFFVGPDGEVAAQHGGPLSADQLKDYRRRILDTGAGQ